MVAVHGVQQVLTVHGRPTLNIPPVHAHAKYLLNSTLCVMVKFVLIDCRKMATRSIC